MLNDLLLAECARVDRQFVQLPYELADTNLQRVLPAHDVQVTRERCFLLAFSNQLAIHVQAEFCAGAHGDNVLPATQGISVLRETPFAPRSAGRRRTMEETDATAPRPRVVQPRLQLDNHTGVWI